MTNDSSYPIRAVERVCDILDLVQQRPDGLTLVDVTKATKLPKSSAFRYLTALEARGYVERGEDGRFLVGLALNSERLDVLTQRVRPYLEKLRDEFGETVSLGMFDRGGVYYLAIVESQRATRTVQRPNMRYPIHASAFGKVFTAWRPDGEVRALLEREGMPRYTEHTITDPEDYLRELARIRERGYAINDREGEPDSRCVAVPVHGLRLPISMSLSAPLSRLSMDDVPLVAEALTEAAREFSALSTRPRDQSEPDEADTP
ncbi:IclR family transcriptional regulator [Jiangella sp. DSM 45060]|uniref:IclR family transcriptional regulator n=1 Tax=Jiangella sp. DSM 45060 TaxID=1798224 RepID=UPI00087BED3E|nr:IclR family transcriptional regulator [Jiangella sp. DSM 45060]SDT21026.1 transcriptional regulator, IclR family [Jiangella sp. DSM 45060]